jgi:hypothetical protein
MGIGMFGLKWPSLLATLLMVPLASVQGACSSSGAAGQDGGGEDGALDAGGSSDGSSPVESSSPDDAPGESSMTTDAPSPTDAMGDARDTGSSDSPADTGPCDPSDQCITTACCPRSSQTCGSLMASGDTVVDSSTGLTWKRSFVSGETGYTTAVSQCTAWGGRLPTQTELTAYAAAQVPCDNQVKWAGPFPTQCEWSSTPYSGGGAHYCIYHDGSAALVASDGDSHWAQCVK